MVKHPAFGPVNDVAPDDRTTPDAERPTHEHQRRRGPSTQPRSTPPDLAGKIAAEHQPTRIVPVAFVGV